MAKDSSSSSKIWRTVVFAGAMLGTPTLATAQSPTPPTPPAGKAAPTASKPAPPPVKADPAQEKQEKIKTLDAERNALLAKIVETDVKELDKLKKDIVAKDAQIRKLVDELVTLRKPRPRALPEARPVGRGFVLA